MTPPITSFTGSYRFLSNFYPSPFTYKGAQYMDVEHAFQAAKTNDPALKRKIQCAKTAARAKSLGRSKAVKAAMRPDWDVVKFGIMLALLRLKFSSDFFLRSSLVSTGDAELIEGNWWGDQVWGVCNGVGENNLGKLLMQVRAEIVDEMARI